MFSPYAPGPGENCIRQVHTILAGFSPRRPDHGEQGGMYQPSLVGSDVRFLTVRHRGSSAGRPPPERGPSAARFRRWPANAPPTAFYGRCGQPAMFDTKAVQGAFTGLMAGSAVHARGVAWLKHGRPARKRPLGVFSRAIWTTSHVCRLGRSEGRLWGLRRHMPHCPIPTAENRGVVVVMACENGLDAGFRRFRSNRLFIGKSTAKRQIFRKIYSRDVKSQRRALRHRRSHFLHNRPWKTALYAFRMHLYAFCMHLCPAWPNAI